MRTLKIRFFYCNSLIAVANTVVTPGLLQKKFQKSVTVRAFFRL